jgi:hypothetical protein
VAWNAAREDGYTAARNASFAAAWFVGVKQRRGVRECHLSRVEAEDTKQASLLREIVGNPLNPVARNLAWLAWNDGAVPKLAHDIYEERRFEDLPILADALEEAGCANADILAHCRQPGAHVRGCWVLDLLLGK